MEIGKLPPDILRRLLARMEADPRVLIGPAYGEDAAAIRFGGSVLVAAADPVTFTTERIGYYAVVVNANDIAVVGGVPRYFLATILLPEGSPREEAEAVFEQIRQSCEEIGARLVGGHTEITDSVQRVVVSGCMLGEAAQDWLVTSSGARVGDRLILVGPVAIEGTSILAREAADELAAAGVSAEAIAAGARYLDDPGICVVDYARTAMHCGGVTSMHDPTEGGLATAIRELAAASGCGVRLRRGSVPVLPECDIFCRALGIDPLGLIASGSLLVTADPAAGETMMLAFESAGVPASTIGEITEPSDGIRFDDGDDLPFFERDEIARYFGARRP